MFTPTTTDLTWVSLIDTAVARIHHGRFGDRKVFISALYASLVADGHLVEAKYTLAQFKSYLVHLSLCGPQHCPLLLLARADFVAGMDSGMVSASETERGIARYHLVIDGSVASVWS